MEQMGERDRTWWAGVLDWKTFGETPESVCVQTSFVQLLAHLVVVVHEQIGRVVPGLEPPPPANPSLDARGGQVNPFPTGQRGKFRAGALRAGRVAERPLVVAVGRFAVIAGLIPLDRGGDHRGAAGGGPLEALRRLWAVGS